MNTLATAFLIYLSIILPFLAWPFSARTLTTPSRKYVYLSTLLTLAITLTLALLASSSNKILLFPSISPGLRDYLLGVAALTILLTNLFWGIKQGTISLPTRWLAPQTTREGLLYILVAACVAVVEEIAYRGSGYRIFSDLLNSRIAGAIASAVCFGLVHRTQGSRAIAVAFVYGLFDQLVVVLTGSLYIMIGVHFLYDVIAGLAIAVRFPVERSDF